ncbi:MAG: site-2 protease family protein, partial [Gemmataceae bacterium]
FGARAVDGDASEILLWPLGGLAFVDIPQHWRAHFITTFAGPAVNLVLMVLCSVALMIGGFLPSLNPIAEPYAAKIHNYRDGKTYGSIYSSNFYQINNPEPTLVPMPLTVTTGKNTNVATTQENLKKVGLEWALAPSWSVWTQRFLQINWVLFLFNMLLPAYPMDCGRLLQAFLWARNGDYRGSTITVCYVGYVAGAILFAIAIYTEAVMLSGLAFFILVNCAQTLYQMESGGEVGPFGYDFSQGYTSLERDDPPVVTKKPGFIKGWWAARKARRIAREAEERARDDERMDQLLDKIAKAGKQALTDEEHRFMERVSARYRNR